MENNEARELCSINFCASAAVESEQGEVGPWIVTIHYCDEHARDVREGTPLGPVGIDNARVSVTPVGSVEPPDPKSRHPGIA